MVAVVSIPTRLRVVKEIQLGLGVDDHQAIGFGTIEKSRDKDSQIATCAELHSGDLGPIRQHHNFRRRKVLDFDERQTASVLHRNILSNRMRAGVSVSDSSLCEIRDHSQKRCRDGYPEERDDPSREQGRGLRRSGVLVPRS
jgi:hypothetical protein